MQLRRRSIFSMNVSSAIRSLVEQEAIATCKALNIANDKFNQDACAVTCLRALSKVKEPTEKVQVTYVCANASALRQAISSEKKTKSAEISANLLNLLK